MSRKLKKMKRLIKGRIIDLYEGYHSIDLFNDFSDFHHPCVLINSISSWPALRLWRPP